MGLVEHEVRHGALYSEINHGRIDGLHPDRVMRKPVPVPWICPPQGGRPPKHGGEFVFSRPEAWGEATAVTVTNTNTGP